MARARREGRLWLRTLLAPAGAPALLQAAVRYAGEGAGAGPLRSWQVTALRIVALHGLIALTCLVFPKKAPKAPNAPREPEAPQVPKPGDGLAG
nr:hypothetical protein StreXyl84_20680 [Streptomyces sp. Xyl84]